MWPETLRRLQREGGATLVAGWHGFCNRFGDGTYDPERTGNLAEYFVRGLANHDHDVRFLCNA